ncbi:MAG TPA: N-6 DNA methylase [Hanamia sp.]
MKLEVKISGNKIFAPLKNKDLILTPEEKVRQEFIVFLVNEYEYSLEQMEQEVKVNNSKRGQGKARADIVIWQSREDKVKSKKPIIVIECKAEHITIHEEDYYQGANYASWAKAKFFVTTNLKNTKFFRVNEELMPNELDEIISIPKASELNNEKKIQELLNQTKVFTRDDFSKLLSKCHNIIRNNDKLSPEAAFDEISKILFMKIRYEREQSKTKALFSKEEFENLNVSYQKIAGKNSKPFYQHFFDETKKIFKDDEIFDTNDTMKIRENSFLEIVKELQKYNLSDTSDDIKGIAFEEFLGKTFRGELGQFFTPRTIVDYMVDVLDPQEGEKICDPCCGSGGFLIKAFEYVREKIEKDVQEAKEEIKKENFTCDFENFTEKKQTEIIRKVDNLFNQLNFELDLQNEKGRLRTLSYDCIFGTDANPRMARTAKMNMIMHGDGHGGVHHHDGLLNVNGIFDGRFDVIFTNPPFGSRVEKTLLVSNLDIPSESKIKLYKERYGDEYETRVIQPLIQWANESNGKSGIGKPIVDLFEVGKMSGLTEVLFIERNIHLLKPGGRMGIVLPEGVLNTSSLQKVREFVEGKAKIINITSIPQDVFIASGATVKPSLLFLKKFTEKEAFLYKKITDEAIAEVDKKYKPQEDEQKKTSQTAEDKYSKAAKTLKEINVLKGRKKGNVQLNKEEYEKLVDRESELKAALKVAKATFAAAMKLIEQQKTEEVKALVKEKFDYPIPIVEVKKAGITSTGARCENELEAVAVEYKRYAKKNKLWNNLQSKAIYAFNNEDEITRAWVVDNVVSEPETIYGK